MVDYIRTTKNIAKFNKKSLLWCPDIVIVNRPGII